MIKLNKLNSHFGHIITSCYVIIFLKFLIFYQNNIETRKKKDAGELYIILLPMSWLFKYSEFVQTIEVLYTMYYAIKSGKLIIWFQRGKKLSHQLIIILAHYIMYTVCTRRPHTDLDFDNSFCTARRIIA